jgi:hypothetical protein
MASAQKYVLGGEYDLGGGTLGVWDGKGFVSPEVYLAKKADNNAAQSKFDAAKVGLQSVENAQAMLARRPQGYSNRVAALDAGEIDPTWLEAFFRNKGGNPSGWGGQMATALTPLRNTTFINQIQQIQKGSPTGGGASLGNSIVEGQRLEGAFGSLAVGQDPAALGRTLSNIEGMVKTWQPGLTPANPMDLTAGQSRDTAPRGAFYRSPEGAVRKNISGNAGNPIVWTPESDPQKAYKDAKLAWNDRWFQRRGNLDGADAAFNQWWASQSGGQKKAPPIPAPPRANNAFSGMSNEQVLNLARGK